MLSRNNGKYVEESVRSVIYQTYKNWELLFVDDSSQNDDAISKMMSLREEGKLRQEDGKITDRINIAQSVYQRGDINIINSALKSARGRWLTFLNVGDVWTPNKLERQISFMVENNYSFTYTQYRLMDSESKDRGFLISGKEHVSYQDMLRCCWPAYLTVMYDAEKVGKVTFRSVWTNYYALWLNVSEKSDSYLIPEVLATLRTRWNRLGKIILTNNYKWRYDAYRIEEGLGRFVSLCYTIRNMWCGLIKWHKYVKRTNGTVL